MPGLIEKMTLVLLLLTTGCAARESCAKKCHQGQYCLVTIQHGEHQSVECQQIPARCRGASDRCECVRLHGGPSHYSCTNPPTRGSIMFPEGTPEPQGAPPPPTR